MLYITRKVGETIIINNNIEVSIVEVKGRTVKLGCSFPREASILRKELHEKIMKENISASSTVVDENSVLEVLSNIKPYK